MEITYLHRNNLEASNHTILEANCKDHFLVQSCWKHEMSMFNYFLETKIYGAYHLIKFDPDWLKKTFLCILIHIFIITFITGSFWDNTSMLTVIPIFHTLLIGLGRYGLQFLQQISFYGLNRLMARSPERIFEFWKQEKVTGSQIWRIRWLSNDFCFVFSQKFSHNQAGMCKNSGLAVRVWRWHASYPKHELQCVESIHKKC